MNRRIFFLLFLFIHHDYDASAFLLHKPKSFSFKGDGWTTHENSRLCSKKKKKDVNNASHSPNKRRDQSQSLITSKSRSNSNRYSHHPRVSVVVPDSSTTDSTTKGTRQSQPISALPPHNQNLQGPTHTGTKTNSHRSPPWQVLSDREAKANILKEKERRELLQKGLKASHEAAQDVDLQQQQGPAEKKLSSALLSPVDRKFLKWKPSLFSSSSTGSSKIRLHMVGAHLGGNKSKFPILGVPEIAFLGRSNVGKSSLLNRLATLVATGGGGGSIEDAARARVGKTPGVTASVNLYAFVAVDDNDKNGNRPKSSQRPPQKEDHPSYLLGLCDLPGFGYAKLPKTVQEFVQATAEHYLTTRRHLVLGVLLVDIRRSPSVEDQTVLAALYDLGVPILVVATKLDKIDSRSKRSKCLEVIQSGLGLPDLQPMIGVSSTTGEGCRMLWNIILEACQTAVQESSAQYESTSTVRNRPASTLNVES